MAAALSIVPLFCEGIGPTACGALRTRASGSRWLSLARSEQDSPTCVRWRVNWPEEGVRRGLGGGQEGVRTGQPH
eukprot:1063713-Prorocentrum_minimum.AAC.1